MSVLKCVHVYTQGPHSHILTGGGGGGGGGRLSNFFGSEILAKRNFLGL